MRSFLIFVFAFISFSAHSQNTPFTSLVFDKVIIYDFGDGHGLVENSIIDEKGRLAKSVTKQAVLDLNTAQILNKKIESKSSYGAGTAPCFDPHLGIVYYLKNKPVAHISVCMDCNRLVPSKSISAQNQGKKGTGKDTYYTLTGMSDSFRAFLNTLLIKNNFSHQLRDKSGKW